MKRNQWLALLGILTFLAIIIYNLSDTQVSTDTQKPADYLKKIQEARTEKDNFFKTSKQSPLKEAQKEAFEGLSYFPIDETYKVEASLERLSEQEALRLPLSDGNEEIYIKYAWAKFTLQGTPQKLLLLKKSRQDPRLFLIFTDASSANSTYAGGRYIDIPHKRSESKIIIDFNEAYNPYCAYNADFACPLPLAENEMKIEIKVGEKNYKKP